MSEFLSLYNLLIMSSFIAWSYFDTLSLIAIKSDKELEDEMIKKPQLGAHILIKGFFYIFAFIGVILLPIQTFAICFVSFLIGTKLAYKSNVLETLLFYKKAEDFKKLINYCNIMSISAICFFAMVIFL